MQAEHMWSPSPKGPKVLGSIIVLLFSLNLTSMALGKVTPKDSTDGHTFITDALKELQIFKKSRGLEKDQSLQRLQALAEKRKNFLSSFLPKDPSSFLRHALPQEVHKFVPKEVHPFLEEVIQKEGTLEIIFNENFEDNNNPLEFWLEDSKEHGKRYKLHFVSETSSLKTGDHVVVKGHKLDNNIVLAAGSTSTQTTSTAAYLPVLGEQKTIVLLASFQDKPSECSTSTVHNAVFSKMNNLYQEASFNQINFTGNVVGPFVIPNNSTDTCSYSTWGTNLHNAAVASGIDMSAYQRWVYVFPSSSCSTQASGYGTLGGNPSKAWILNHCSYGELFAHEVGHNLGMSHASTATSEYGDHSDVLGAPFAGFYHMNAPHKAAMQWVPSNNVLNVTQDGTYTMNLLEQSASVPQILKIAKPDTSETYFLGYRVPINHDASLSSTYAYKTNIHRQGASSAKTYFLSGLDDGITFRDDTNGIVVTQLSHNANSSTVFIDFTAPICMRNSPLLTVTPLSQSAGPGKSLNYTISIKNQNASSCPMATFQMANLSLPSGWSGVFNPSSINLNSGLTQNVIWSVSSSLTAPDGSYPVSAKATDANDVTKTASANATYIVFADTEPPVVDIKKPLDQAQITAMTTVEVSAADNGGMSKVEFYVDGGLKASDSSVPFTYNLNPKKMSAGTHGVMALGYDKNGNTASDIITVNVVK